MIEFLLSIFYFSVFCFIISKTAFFKEEKIPTHWFIIVFGIKVIVSILLTLIYTTYYTDRETADIFKYFDDSKIMFDALLTNPIDYFKMLFGIDFDNTYLTSVYYDQMNHWTRPYADGLFSDTHIIIRFNAFIRLFSFGHFQVHNIFINFISLIGLTTIYKSFKSFLIQKERVLFYIIFLIPSVLFWGSGLLKESIIFFGLGLLLFNLYKITQKHSIKAYLYIFIGLLLITYTKFYLLIALSIPVLGYFINLKLKKRISYGYIISFLSFLAIIKIAPYINEKFNLVYQIASKQQTFSRFISEVKTSSGFIIPELSDGWSILIYIPNALLNTIIRPYLWECNSIFVWLSAIENLAILFCIFVVLFYRKKLTALQKNVLLFNLTFVFCLFSLIGLTTPVFGAIMRYKIPGLLLLLISLLLLVDLEKIKAKNTFLKKLL